MNTPADSLVRHPLTRFFHEATLSAAQAMRQWTSGSVSLALEEVSEIPLESVSQEFALDDELLTMIVHTLDGPMGGQFILAFDEQNGRSLAACLTGKSVPTDSEWTDVERSALQETGNILSCAYLNTLTELVGEEMVPSPPYFVQDFGASVLQQALMAQAMVRDDVLVCRTRFNRDGQDLNWNVFFVPSDPLRQALLTAAEEPLEETRD